MFILGICASTFSPNANRACRVVYLHCSHDRVWYLYQWVHIWLRKEILMHICVCVQLSVLSVNFSQVTVISAASSFQVAPPSSSAPQNYCCWILYSFSLAVYPSLSLLVLLGCCCPHIISQFASRFCSTEVGTQSNWSGRNWMASPAKGVRMTDLCIHTASPRTVGVKSVSGCRTQQKLIVWVLARKKYFRHMWCSNGYRKSMLCICRHITGPSPLCCNCYFPKLTKQKC